MGDEVGRQVAAVKALREDFPHGVVLVEAAMPDDPSTFRYTCFQFAFGLVDLPESVRRICEDYPHIYPSSDFVEYLVAEVLCPVVEGNLADGDLVVYRKSAKVTHAGIVLSNRVRSKWGTAHLWEHGFLEVPASYGSSLSFFSPLSGSKAVEAFLSYAKIEIAKVDPEHAHECRPTDKCS